MNLTDSTEPPEPVFSRYRRNLPHWRLTDATYYVTWKLKTGQPNLSDSERDRVASALRHFDGDRYELFAFVVMDDHVHVLVKPIGDHLLEKILRSWKLFTASEFQKKEGRVGAVWQGETFDRIVRDEAEFWQKVWYIIQNPRRRWPEIRSYRWVWPDPEEANSLRLDSED